jgi:hypothetical protein
MSREMSADSSHSRQNEASRVPFEPGTEAEAEIETEAVINPMFSADDDPHGHGSDRPITTIAGSADTEAEGSSSVEEKPAVADHQS